MLANIRFFLQFGKIKKAERFISKPLSFLVSEMRLELTRANAHYPLKVARLPIPPSGLVLSQDCSCSALERKTGLEPATPTLARLCSTN